MKKLLGAVAAAVFLFSACAAGTGGMAEVTEPQSYRYVIGVSQANLIEPWRVAQYEEIKEQGGLHENIQFIFRDAANDARRQKEDVSSMLQMGIDLLIISPVRTDVLDQETARGFEHIPVIVMDQEIESEMQTLYVGTDNREIGVKAGKAVVAMLGEKGGTVVEITGKTDSPPSKLLSEGFYSVIGQNPQVTLTDKLDGDWLRDTAEMRMKDYLIKNDDIDIVFAHNDAMAEGASIAAREFRVQGIRYIGVDGLEDEGKRLVDEGVLTGTFTRSVGGKEAVEYALKILDSKGPLPERIILGSARYFQLGVPVS